MMTKQEMFDIVAKHLLTQNAKATNPSGTQCMYRAIDGKKCAAGCLIPDDKYHQDFEGKPINGYVLSPLISLVVGDRNLDLLRRLQIVHDQTSVEAWEYVLRGVAQNNGLRWNL